MKLFAPRLIVGLGAVALLSVGCSKDADPAPSDGEMGAISIALQQAPGVSLNSVSYSVSGPAAFSRMGTANVGASSQLTFTIGGVPAGGGYTITVSGTLSGAPATCAGSAIFAVTARATTVVSLHLRCNEAPRNGTVRVNGTVNICPVIDSVTVNPAEVFVGSSLSLGGEAHDTDLGPSPLSYLWTASSGTLSDPSAQGPTFTCTAAGTATVTLTISDGDCGDTVTETVVCSPGGQPAPAVVINEIESSGGTPGDWVELYNAGPSPANVSGWIVKDNDDTHAYILPAGTNISAGGYLIVEEAALGFGLGGADSVRLFNASGVTVVDSHAWAAHATTTYGRCPNGAGEFVTSATSTKGAPNSCGGTVIDAGAGETDTAPGDGGATSDGAAADAAADAPVVVTTLPWPGRNEVAVVDQPNQFGTNLSGLTYQPAAGGAPAVLWAAQNGPSVIFRLVWNGSAWVFATADDWVAGKTIRYPGGGGAPDTESLTKAEWDSSAVYVATERDNNNNTVSRLSVLRFDTSGPGATLTATHEWNLTAELPVVGANLGLEAITWVPDHHLVAAGFFDESRNQPYNPALYPDHGGGLFLLGIEANGIIYAYAFDHAGGGATRIATFSSGHPGVMGIEFDREAGYLWAHCDNTCGNKVAVLGIDAGPSSPTRGRFRVRRFFDRPSTLPDLNNEGIAMASESECVNGRKPYFWADDGVTGGHALRQDAIPCGMFPL